MKLTASLISVLRQKTEWIWTESWDVCTETHTNEIKTEINATLIGFQN